MYCVQGLILTNTMYVLCARVNTEFLRNEKVHSNSCTSTQIPFSAKRNLNSGQFPSVNISIYHHLIHNQFPSVP